VAQPLKLYDSSPITDGAAAVILASEVVAKKLTPMWIKAIGYANGTANLSKIGLEAAQVAAKNGLQKGGHRPGESGEASRRG
jgi:acetyl-CoA C-acetyltransferase